MEPRVNGLFLRFKHVKIMILFTTPQDYQGDFALDKFQWTNFDTRNFHQIFRIVLKNKPTEFYRRKICPSKKKIFGSAPFPLFLVYFLNSSGGKTCQFYGRFKKTNKFFWCKLKAPKYSPPPVVGD